MYTIYLLLEVGWRMNGWRMKINRMIPFHSLPSLAVPVRRRGMFPWRRVPFFNIPMTDDRSSMTSQQAFHLPSAICKIPMTDDRCLHNKHFIFTFVASNIINLSYYSVSNLATSITCSPPLLFSLHCSLLRYWAKVSSVTTWNPNTVRSIGHIWKSKTINVEVWHNLESTFQLDHAPYFWLTMYST